MTTDLEAWAKDRGVKYFMISFTDLFGAQRAKLVPTAAIKGMQEEGAGFAGFATWLDMTPAHPDLFARPDAESAIQLPWKKETAWVAADCWMDDKPVDQAPRNTLKRLVAEAASDGLRVKTALGEQTLGSGETARYRADVEHEIVNDGSVPARALMVVVYE